MLVVIIQQTMCPTYLLIKKNILLYVPTNPHKKCNGHVNTKQIKHVNTKYYSILKL